MKDLHTSVREIAVLQEATEMILSSMDLDTVLHQILLIVRNYFGVSNCAVFLVDPATNQLYCRAQNGYASPADQERRFAIGVDGVLGWVAASKAPRYVPDVSKEPLYIPAADHVRSELSLPLLVRDEVIGVLDLESDQLDYFRDDMIGLLTLFAGQAAVALEKARLYSTERRRMRQIELINLIARSATSASDVDYFLNTLADLLYDSFDGTEVCVLFREADGAFSVRAHAGSQAVEPERFAAAERSGAIAQAVAARINVVVNDIPARDGWPACLEGMGSEMCVPLVSFGEPLGLILVAHAAANFFTSDDRSIAQAAADVCATAIRNVQLSEELRRVTSTDSLTGTFNQRYFHASVSQEISRAKRYGKQLALLMIDLQDFGQVNAAIGFDRGDQILREVAQALKGQLRSNDTLCRYAGDRFGIVLPETGGERAQAVLQKLRAALAEIDVGPPGQTCRLVLASSMVTYPADGAGELELVRLLLLRLAEGKKATAGA